jgi:hypothetical protein
MVWYGWKRRMTRAASLQSGRRNYGFVSFRLLGTVDRTQPNGDNWQYAQYQSGPKVAVTPLTASPRSSQTRQFPATTIDSSRNQVVTPTFTWAVLPGGPGTVDATDLYTAPDTRAANSVDTIKCQLTVPNSWTTITVAPRARRPRLGETE